MVLQEMGGADDSQNQRKLGKERINGYNPHRKAFFGKCIVVLKGKGTLKAQAIDLKDATLSL